MRHAHVIVASLLITVWLGCNRNPEDPKKPGTPPPNPNPVPSVPQAASAPSADSSQPNIVPSPSTQKRGPDMPAVGSVQQPPRKPGGDANPTVTTPGPTSPGAR
jgi:hypothetical protein